MLSQDFDKMEDQFYAFRDYKIKYSIAYLTKFIVKYKLFKPYQEHKSSPDLEKLHDSFLSCIGKFAF